MLCCKSPELATYIDTYVHFVENVLCWLHFYHNLKQKNNINVSMTCPSEYSPSLCPPWKKNICEYFCEYLILHHFFMSLAKFFQDIYQEKNKTWLCSALFIWDYMRNSLFSPFSFKFSFFVQVQSFCKLHRKMAQWIDLNPLWMKPGACLINCGFSWAITGSRHGYKKLSGEPFCASAAGRKSPRRGGSVGTACTWHTSYRPPTRLSTN